MIQRFKILVLPCICERGKICERDEICECDGVYANVMRYTEYLSPHTTAYTSRGNTTSYTSRGTRIPHRIPHEVRLYHHILERYTIP